MRKIGRRLGSACLVMFLLAHVSGIENAVHKISVMCVTLTFLLHDAMYDIILYVLLL